MGPRPVQNSVRHLTALIFDWLSEKAAFFKDAAFTISEWGGQAAYPNPVQLRQYFARFDFSFMLFELILTPILCQKF
jgi:hypothetical protein